MDGGCEPCPKSLLNTTDVQFNVSACLFCNESTTCMKCVSTAYLNANDTCTLCPLSCASCSEEGCSACQEGFYFQAGECLACGIADCLACSGSDVCTQAAYGFYVANGIIERCPVGCSACKSATVCTGCSSSYFLNALEQCQPCVGGCSTCLTQSYCLGCAQSYALSSGAVCLACSAHCVACSSPFACSACASGYDVSNGVCEEESSGLAWWAILLIVLGSIALLAAIGNPRPILSVGGAPLPQRSEARTGHFLHGAQQRPRRRTQEMIAYSPFRL